MANYRKLGRVTSHRNLMLRNLVTDLLRCGRIETTVTRAKETRRMAEKMITLAKRGDQNFGNVPHNPHKSSTFYSHEVSSISSSDFQAVYK